VLSPGPYVLALGAGVIDEMLSMPEEWTGSSGFAKRSTSPRLPSKKSLVRIINCP
jgi:hypothetical protein